MKHNSLRVIPMIVLLAASGARAGEWVRGGADGKEPWWGYQNGLQFAIAPASDGPRGLIRMLYPTLPGKKYDLINYIAIQPVVNGKEGYSELERSTEDGQEGKRLWVDEDQRRGRLLSLAQGVEMLRVVIHVEKFKSGAHVRVIVEQRSDRPDEVTMTLQPEADTAAMEYCVLSATMGNMARTRLLWLKDETVNSLKLYPDHSGSGFASSMAYPLRKLAVTDAGELLVATTTDERRPADVHPFADSNVWYYGGFPVTQFWKKAKGTWRDDVRVLVNGRSQYWGTEQTVPGGVAFENFELRERFYPGQQFIFGITRKTPRELGLGAGAASRPAVETRPGS